MLFIWNVASCNGAASTSWIAGLAFGLAANSDVFIISEITQLFGYVKSISRIATD